MPTEDTTTSPSGVDVNKLLTELEVPFSPDGSGGGSPTPPTEKKRGQIVPYADPRLH